MADPRSRRYLGEVVAGRYLIDHLVGEGSFAWVYHAVDRSGGDVAVKVLHSREPSARLRFAREARVLRALPRDRHVAGYLAEGETRDGHPALVIEFVDGITLKHGMQGRAKVEPAKAAAFLTELCEAFAGLHQLGVVHRDVKPENILLARSGAIKLIDFGLIRDAQGILKLLEAEDEALGEHVFAAEVDTGILAGTPEYMSPEQFSDAAAASLSAGLTDTSSDVFSLGVILFQLLTGRKPFPMKEASRADYPAELLRYFHYRIGLGDEDVPPMPGVPVSLQSIVRKALRAAPRRRQPDARALRDDLARYLESGRGVRDGDESRTVSVAVDQIFGPEPDLAPVGTAPLSPFEDDEVTAVRKPRRRPRRDRGSRRGNTALFFDDVVSTVTDLGSPGTGDTDPASAPPALEVQGERRKRSSQPPTDDSMQPGPRQSEPPPAPAPERKRSAAGRRISRTPSIFEQDTRRVNVAEILPDEVAGPRPPPSGSGDRGGRA